MNRITVIRSGILLIFLTFFAAMTGMQFYVAAEADDAVAEEKTEAMEVVEAEEPQEGMMPRGRFECDEDLVFNLNGELFRFDQDYIEHIHITSNYEGPACPDEPIPVSRIVLNLPAKIEDENGEMVPMPRVAWIVAHDMEIEQEFYRDYYQRRRDGVEACIETGAYQDIEDGFRYLIGSVIACNNENFSHLGPNDWSSSFIRTEDDYTVPLADNLEYRLEILLWTCSPPSGRYTNGRLPRPDQVHLTRDLYRQCDMKGYTYLPGIGTSYRFWFPDPVPRSEWVAMDQRYRAMLDEAHIGTIQDTETTPQQNIEGE